MRVEQISVFLENRTGRLAEVASILSQAGINIRALTVADTSDFGLLRMIVSDTEKARRVLKENGFTIGKHDVVAVEVVDQPGGLYHILDLLSRVGVNVEYMYAFVERCGENAVIIFRFDNTDEAIQVLTKGGVHILEGARIYNM